MNIKKLKKLKNYQLSNTYGDPKITSSNMDDIEYVIVSFYNRRKIKKMIAKYIRNMNKNRAKTYKLNRIYRINTLQNGNTYSFLCDINITKNKKAKIHTLGIYDNLFKIIKIPIEKYNKLENIYDIKELIKISEKSNIFE